jgi:tRNA(fMet)-specific endonuclease VapC
VAELILDTGILVAIERGRLRLVDVASPADDIAISAVTAAELWLGLELADDANRSRRSTFVQGIFDLVDVETYDLEVARVHGRLLAENRHAGRQRGFHDLIIAATAAARNRVLMTSDKGFTGLPGVQVRLVG